MHISKAIWLPGLFAVLALVLVACGGSDPTATPSPAAAISPTASAVSQQGLSGSTMEESNYLGEVLRAEQSAEAIFQAFATVFSQSYPVREALLAALLEGGVGTPFIGKLAILEALDPPDRFREDHRIWLEATRESLRIDTEAAEAVRDGDLVRFVLLNGQLGENDVSARLALSPVYCRSAASQTQGLLICAPEESALNGEYETGINDLLRELMPAFSRLQGTLGFRLSLTPEELDQVLTENAANSLVPVQAADSALGAITPPEGLRADHERLQTFFVRATGILNEVDRLREGGDLDAARGELLKLDPAFCDARASFESDAFKDAVAILFVGNPRTCGGAPF